MKLQSKFQLTAVHSSDLNAVAQILKILAILEYGGGFLSGIIIGGIGQELGGDFLWIDAFAEWGNAFLYGSLLFGFSEIIDILHTIAHKEYAGTAEGDLIQQTTQQETTHKTETSAPSIFKETTAHIGELANGIEIAASTDDKHKTILFKQRPEQSITCPLCGEIQRPDRNVCWACGAKFKFQDEEKV